MTTGHSDTTLVASGPELTDPEQVGHKFARQVVLSAAGFPVPPLVCVPAGVYDAVVGPEVAAAVAEAQAPVPELAARLRERIPRLPLPATLAAALTAGFDDLAGPRGLVAVRACVVPRPGDPSGGEDGEQDPFAGLSDSYLYVARDQLAARIAQCWASAFNPEAVAYRVRRGLDPLTARVAVGVQRMAMGTRSFVAFTRDPRDGAARCVVAAAHGIGEGVVQERADVDHFFVDRASGGIESEIVVKTRAVGFDPLRPADGPVPLPVPERLAALPVLTEAEVKEITDLALRVEEHFGGPQDIEGALTADGAVHLVQARPATAQSAPPDPRPQPRPGTTTAATAPGAGTGTAATATTIWDNNNVTESFPGVSSALTFSVAHRLYEVGFGDLYRRMGVPARTLRRNQSLLAQMIGHLDGRVYYRLDSWYRLHAQMRCFRPLWSTWEQSLGLAGRDPGRKEGLRAADALHVAEIAGRLAVHPLRVRAFLRWWDGYHERFADVDRLAPDEAVAAYRALWQEVARRWGVTLVNGVFLFTATLVTNRLLKRWVPDADRGLLNGMLVGGPDNRSAAALHSLIAAAETCGSSPELREAVLGDTPARQLWDDLMAAPGAAPPQPATPPPAAPSPAVADPSPEGPPAAGLPAADPAARTAFAGALREHIRRHGDRGMHDLKLESATPRTQPWTVLHDVRVNLRQGLTVAAVRESARQVRAQAQTELRERCGNPLKRAALGAGFAAMRGLLKVREDTRFCRTQLFGDTRALLLRLGAELAAAGRLDDARDVLDLTADEVLGAFDGTLAGSDLRGLAAVRAAERERWSQLPPLPARLETEPGVPPAAALAAYRAGVLAGRDGPPAGTAPGGPAGDGTVLRGLASSAGTVRGRAKVVLDPTVTAEECEGRILVARETDPGWLFLMMSARALVVERGTLLSHTAITGRLLGIPTVVAVRDATALIADGAPVEVDGRAGTVRLLDEEPS
ncbi:PEP/pyruvate-binding domain-containing protein [Streptomyces sp. V4-01]|uniref:PEP/pyruvate-binding domain-containing protein n=1 Tax=Actinacidiphila polyblastidii TaxID=3110430 RepID=A0ABU7P9I9_9ACTN|nr:PEP/pyruvate-binding domain-containing protein [Streptomyces sp. V4-01]